MWVKICGTTNLADAQLAVAHGADALGFIFAPSKRRITVEQAAAITAELPPGIERVGVFTASGAADIADIVAGAALTAVQLHRPYDAEQIAELRDLLGPEVKLIQVLGVTTDLTTAQTATNSSLVNQLLCALGDRTLWAILLDSQRNGDSGGLGVAFPWRGARLALNEALGKRKALAEQPASDLPSKPPHVLLAGGLHAGNVVEAIQTIHPWGVDCVSGVEDTPGKKDPDRLARFVAAARDGLTREIR